MSQSAERVVLHGGRSGLLVAGTARLVLLRGGAMVREIPISPDPDRTMTVQ
jgi:hypothetical protein